MVKVLSWPGVPFPLWSPVRRALGVLGPNSSPLACVGIAPMRRLATRQTSGNCHR